MNPKEIMEMVDLHRIVYQTLGKEVPKFRITRSELKILWQILKVTIPKKENNELPHYDECTYLMGVELEIVTIG